LFLKAINAKIALDLLPIRLQLFWPPLGFCTLPNREVEVDGAIRNAFLTAILTPGIHFLDKIKGGGDVFCKAKAVKYQELEMPRHRAADSRILTEFDGPPAEEVVQSVESVQRTSAVIRKRQRVEIAEEDDEVGNGEEDDQRHGVEHDEEGYKEDDEEEDGEKHDKVDNNDQFVETDEGTTIKLT